MIKPIITGHINPCKNMMCHTLQPLFDYTARQFVNSSIVSFCGGVTALIKWALDINRNSNLPVLVGAPRAVFGKYFRHPRYVYSPETSIL